VKDRIFITGLGVISATGFDSNGFASALKHSKSGIAKAGFLNTIHSKVFPVGEVKASNSMLLEMANCRTRGYNTRTSLLGTIAAREAYNDAEVFDNSDCRTGLISATTVGGMDRSEIFFRDFVKKSTGGRLRDIIAHDCGHSTERIADELNIKDYISTVSTACSSSANAILYGARLIKNGILDRVIAGGADALTLFTLNGFNSLMILDKEVCKPFDNNRNGLNLGEAAAYVVLESENIVVKKKKTALCELKGYGNACDAFHQTASSPEGTGAYLAMKKALDNAGIEPGAVDYINVHGTGTRNNDLSEGIAIERVFEKNVPLCSSTKAYTGHTLGAAGAVEAVACVLAIMNGWIYPNLNFKQQMTELRFSPVTNFLSEMKIRNIMSNSLPKNNTLDILVHLY